MWPFFERTLSRSLKLSEVPTSPASLQSPASPRSPAAAMHRISFDARFGSGGPRLSRHLNKRRKGRRRHITASLTSFFLFTTLTFIVLFISHARVRAIYYQVATYRQSEDSVPSITDPPDAACPRTKPPDEVRTVNDTNWRTCDSFYAQWVTRSSTARQRLLHAPNSEEEALLALSKSGINASTFLAATLNNCVDGERILWCLDSSITTPIAAMTPHNFPLDLRGTFVVTHFFRNEYTWNGGDQRCCGRPQMTLVRRASPICRSLDYSTSLSDSEFSTNASYYTNGYLDCSPDGSGTWHYCTDASCKRGCKHENLLYPNMCQGRGGLFQRSFCLTVQDDGQSNADFLQGFTDCPNPSGQRNTEEPQASQPKKNPRNATENPWLGFGDLMEAYGWI